MTTTTFELNKLYRIGYVKRNKTTQQQYPFLTRGGKTTTTKTQKITKVLILLNLDFSSLHANL